MSPAFLGMAKAHFEPHEGNVPYMYRCTNPQVAVTAGIGHLFATEESATLVRWERLDGSPRPVTRSEIIEAYRKVAAMPHGRLASFYAPATTIRLSQATIEALFERDIRNGIEFLMRQFPEWDTWPDPAQLGMLDMVYSVGTRMFGNVRPYAYPKLIAAARRQDWATCAQECGRINQPPRREKATRALFEAAIPAKK